MDSVFVESIALMYCAAGLFTLVYNYRWKEER